MATESQITIKVEFSGGLELLFSNQRTHQVTLPAVVPAESSKIATESFTEVATNAKPVDVNYLLRFLRDNLLKERVELFMEGDML